MRPGRYASAERFQGTDGQWMKAMRHMSYCPKSLSASLTKAISTCNCLQIFDNLLRCDALVSYIIGLRSLATGKVPAQSPARESAACRQHLLALY